LRFLSSSRRACRRNERERTVGHFCLCSTQHMCLSLCL
jgi:hypothetical protein